MRAIVMNATLAMLKYTSGIAVKMRLYKGRPQPIYLSVIQQRPQTLFREGIHNTVGFRCLLKQCFQLTLNRTQHKVVI